MLKNVIKGVFCLLVDWFDIWKFVMVVMFVLDVMIVFLVIVRVDLGMFFFGIEVS